MKRRSPISRRDAAEVATVARGLIDTHSVSLDNGSPVYAGLSFMGSAGLEPAATLRVKLIRDISGRYTTQRDGMNTRFGVTGLHPVEPEKLTSESTSSSPGLTTR